MTCVLAAQVGRSLYLLGKHRAAVDVYDEALKLQDDDAELWISKGLCAVQLRDYDRWAGKGHMAASVAVSVAQGYATSWLHSIGLHKYQSTGSNRDQLGSCKGAGVRGLAWEPHHSCEASCVYKPAVDGVLAGPCSPSRRPTPYSPMTPHTCR